MKFKKKIENILETTGSWIRDFIDLFYPVFKRYMPLQFFRYGVTGVANLFFDWVLYFFIYNFILQQQMLHLWIFTLSSHIASFAIKFPIVLLSGFLLQKYVTFSESDLRGHRQLLRYLIVYGVNILINYFGLKLFVDIIHVFPSISNMIVSVITVFVSYFLQKSYTFKISNS
ncbi:MAG: GtrA family protein [Rikenellaceae bacterium]|nr:GtrA family protein [Rikenellaceae bacterium]